MKIRNLTITLLFFLSIKAAFCAVPPLESDTFNLDKDMEDSKQELNKVVENIIKSSIIKVNVQLLNQDNRCDEGLFFENMQENLDLDFKHSKVGEYIEKIMEKRKIQMVDIDTSIYEDWDIFFLVKLASNINVGGKYVANDKIDHFLQQGFAYFEKTYLEHKGLITAINYGDYLESGYFGLMVSGVYSFADLVANFNGMRFYNHIFGHYPDALRIPFTPILKCVDGSFKINRSFDWSDYIDNGWREDINCSGMLGYMHMNHMLDNPKNKNHRCSPDSGKRNKKLLMLKKKYRNFSPYLLNHKWKNMDVL